MIQKGTFLDVIDNLSIKEIKNIQILESLKKKQGNLGDFITASVKKMVLKKTKNIELKKGSLVVALVIQTKNINSRLDGQKIKFFKNAAILVDKQKKILGSRIEGSICKEFRKSKSIKFTNSSFVSI